MEENILKKIENMIPRLSLKQKVVAVAVLQDPLSASFLPVKEFAEKINVSPATIVRFAKEVTGEGFPELQTELHKYVHSITNPIKRLKLQIITDSKDDEFLSKVYETQLNNLKSTFNQSFLHNIVNAYELIAAADHVYTLGSRGSLAAAYYLGQHLNRALGNADVVRDDDTLADFMRRTGEKDVAIFFGAPRYSARLVTAAQALHAKGTKIISVNGSPNSPFLAYSDVYFLAPTNSNDFHNSLLAPMLTAELLISFIITKQRESTLTSLSEYEPYFDSLGQFYSSD